MEHSKNLKKTIFCDPQNPSLIYWCFEIIPSTHQFALEYDWGKELFANRNIVLFSPQQTSGIGSHGRQWVSKNANFHANFVFYAKKPIPSTQIAAWTVCQQLTQETQNRFRFQLKWPNDVLVDGKKICGCLSHVRQEADRYWITVGVGINYNPIWCSRKNYLPGTISLSECLQRPDFSDAELFQAVQRFSRRFYQNLKRYEKEGIELFYRDCQNDWLYLRQNVTIFDEDRQAWLAGIFHAITPNGALQLKDQDGNFTTILNGTGLRLAENNS